MRTFNIEVKRINRQTHTCKSHLTKWCCRFDLHGKGYKENTALLRAICNNPDHVIMNLFSRERKSRNQLKPRLHNLHFRTWTNKTVAY